MYKHILLATDYSEASSRAEKECIAFAKSSGAKVTVIHVIPHFHLHYQPWATPREMHETIEKGHEEEARETAAKAMSGLESRIREQGVACEGLVAIGDNPYEEIIAGADTRGCDLIMMASHGRRGIDAMLLGSETQKVLTHSKLPVLVVR
ncbi:MAG: universal stress protein [Burkholderiales bacterium]|nr:universal stress protein [Burkholderiales bacterium]